MTDRKKERKNEIKKERKKETQMSYFLCRHTFTQINLELAQTEATTAQVSEVPDEKKDRILTVNQREEVSEDGESPSHFFGTIWSAGVVSDEASELQQRCALFPSDIPGSAALSVWTLHDD